MKKFHDPIALSKNVNLSRQLRLESITKACFVESDGNDIKKVFNACKKGTNYVRNNSKPFFLSFNNYRWREHCGPNYDNGIGYRTEKEFRDWKKRDPLLISYTLLKKLKINKKIISAIEKKQTLKIINAFRFAEKSKFPNKKELLRDVYR
jgi:pyruvate dehydrogenase E1 component alpha subunit